MLPQERQHRLDYLGCNPRRSVVVEINNWLRVHEFLTRDSLHSTTPDTSCPSGIGYSDGFWCAANRGPYSSSAKALRFHDDWNIAVKWQFANHLFKLQANNLPATLLRRRFLNQGKDAVRRQAVQAECLAPRLARGGLQARTGARHHHLPVPRAARQPF